MMATCTFSLQAMPWQAQLSPFKAGAVIDANNDSLPDILLFGNYDENNIEMGRYDADFGTLLVNKGNHSFAPSSLNGLTVKGEVRQLKNISIKGKAALVAARNNDSVLVMQFQPESNREKISDVFYTSLFARFAKPSFTALVIEQRFFQVFFPEIGPQYICKIQFGISNLVQQEIADAVFTAGADQQFGVGEIFGAQVLLKAFVRDVVRRQVAGFHIFGDVFYRAEQFPAAAVRERDNHVKPGIASRFVERFLQCLLRAVGQHISGANHVQADVVFVEC